jgi:peptidoglycan/xylan/chitin deacetylase (PgdA/CDA1 family)
VGARHVPLGRPGRASARNIGFAVADTELVAFVDGQCRPGEGWLRSLEHAIEGHAGAVSRVRHGGRVGMVRMVPHAGMTPTGYVGPWICAAGGGALFDQRLLREVGLFSPQVRYWDDLYITTRLVGYGRTVGQAGPLDVHLPRRAHRRQALNLRSGYWLADLRDSGELHGTVETHLCNHKATNWLAHKAHALPTPWRAGHRLPVHTRTHLTGGRPVVHVTIDDGPSPNTPALLRVLHKHRAKADFFVIGNQVREHPQLLAEIIREGHAVHNHSLTHRQLDGLSADDIRHELDETARLIGPAPRPGRPLIRLPFGAGADDQYVHDAIRRWRRGSELVQWSIDSDDYKSWPLCTDRTDVEREAEAAADRVLRARDLTGSIILMHDNAYGARLPLVETFSQILLDRLLTGLKESGLATARLRGRGQEHV